MATKGGATLIGRDDIGSIEVGKAADIVLFRIDDLSFAGTIHDPVAALLMCGVCDRADMTIVNGKIRVKEGVLVDIDEYELYEASNKIAKRMRRMRDTRTVR